MAAVSIGGSFNGSIRWSFVSVEVRAEIAACQADVECDDGLFCNGPESCIFGTCLPGAAPSCDDAMACCAQPIPTMSRPGLLALILLLGAAASLLARRTPRRL